MIELERSRYDVKPSSSFSRCFTPNTFGNYGKTFSRSLNPPGAPFLYLTDQPHPPTANDFLVAATVDANQVAFVSLFAQPTAGMLRARPLDCSGSHYDHVSRDDNLRAPAAQPSAAASRIRIVCANKGSQPVYTGVIERLGDFRRLTKHFSEKRVAMKITRVDVPIRGLRIGQILSKTRINLVWCRYYDFILFLPRHVTHNRHFVILSYKTTHIFNYRVTSKFLFRFNIIDIRLF